MARSGSQRWLRLSRVHLVIVALVVAALIGWRIHYLRERDQVCDEIRNLGGFVSSNHVYVCLSGPDIDDQLFGSVAGKAAKYLDVHYLFLMDTRITDSSLSYLPQFSHLREVNLENTSVTDEGLHNLTESKTLETLWLSGTSVSDESIPTIAQIPSLRQVGLSDTRVTKSGAAELRKTTGLLVY